MSSRFPEYTEAEIDFLREFYPTHTFKQTWEVFNNKFGYHTESQVRHRIKKNHILTVGTGRFEKGHESWNKGISIKNERPDLYKMIKSFNHDNFKESGKASWFKGKPIGSEAVYGGRLFVKVENPDVWKPKARIVYESYFHTVLKSDEKILHLNGNKMDCNIDNLVVVNDAILMKLNKFGLIFEDKELTKVCVTKEKLLKKIRELENESKKDK